MREDMRTVFARVAAEHLAKKEGRVADGIGACHHPKNVERVCLERGRLFLLCRELTVKLSANSLHFLSPNKPASNFPPTTRTRVKLSSLQTIKKVVRHHKSQGRPPLPETKTVLTENSNI